MFRSTILMILFLLFLPLLLTAESGKDMMEYWPQWRGPLGTGAAPDGNPPVEWNEETNIRWKIRLPGPGYSTPAIWGNTIFISTAIGPEDYTPPRRGTSPTQPVKYIVMAVNRSDGKVLWERLAKEEVPHAGQHETSTWATSSPITDGERVYAHFGSRGLFCYTFEGDLVWEKNFGDMSIRRSFGEGSSPVLYKDRLIVNWDHEGQSFIVALNVTNGEELWRTDRDEGTTWMTPVVVEETGRAQVICSGTKRVRSYDLASGKLLWDGEGLTANVIPTPVAANGVVYVISGFRGSVLRAIRLSAAKGNIDGSSAVLWSYDQGTPYVPSPLLHDGILYFLRDNKGILTSMNIATGQPHYANQRLESIRDVYASPAGVRDRVYLLSRDGVTMVIRHGAKYEVLTTNNLDDSFDASPVIVGDELYLRGHTYLYCIARP